MLYVLFISDGLADVKTIIKPVGLARVHVELFIRPNDLWDIAGPRTLLSILVARLLLARLPLARLFTATSMPGLCCI